MSGGLDTATESAIDWLVLMRSGEATPADRRGLEDWLSRAPAHRQAWARLAGTVDAAFSAARDLNSRHPGQADVLAATLDSCAARSGRRRQLLRGVLAVAGLGTAAGLLAERQLPLQDILADWRTGTGERGDFPLADGSRLRLNARSAADDTMAPDVRGIRLRRGEALVDVLAAARPFVLAGAHGSLRASAGQDSRVLLRQQDGRSLAVALDRPVELSSAGGLDRVLAAGEAAWFGPDGIDPAPGLATTAAAWKHGQLEVHGQPLGEVVAALRPYRAGFIRISPEAARLRVYGSYPLDDSDRALLAIGETLPVRMHMHSGGWLVRIDLA